MSDTELPAMNHWPPTTLSSHWSLATSHSTNEQFAQYLTAIKGAKLSEMQLQKLGESRDNDDRTRTIEKINERKAQSDDEQYRKMRGNGYTVGETRRGVDQVEKALERKEVQSAERKAQSAETKVGMERSVMTGKGDGDQSADHRDEENNLCVLRSALCDFKLQTSDVANASVTQAGDVIANDAGNVSQVNGHANTTEQLTINASEQQANHHATSAGSLVGRSAGIAASLAAVMAGMTPVSQSETVRRNGELDAKIASVAGMTSTSKDSAKDNVTQEALTAASETQQAANDPGQSQPDPYAAQAARDVAVTQTLPNTSLMERVDQARLTNRVASAFRSLANQSGTIRMKLHPEELGALTIRMQIEAGQVSAKLEAETETAKQVLLENIETLKKKLKEQNLEMAAFDIEVIQSATSKMQMQQPGRAIARQNKNQTEHVDLYS